MHIFYEPIQTSDHIILNEVESKHCTKVLRLSIDDIVYVIDGQGGFFKCQILDNTHKKCLLKKLLLCVQISNQS